VRDSKETRQTEKWSTIKIIQMSGLVIVREKPQIVTTRPELIVMAIIVIAAIVTMVLIYLVLKPKLFSGSKFKGAEPPSQTVTCPTSPAPTGLTAKVVDKSKASFDASWNPVLTATTAGAVIVGYNVYVSTKPGITALNTSVAGFAPSPLIRVTTTGSGNLQFGVTYYYRVATVDTCGPGALSAEEFSIPV
jgi:hypothetical protein